MKMNWMAMWDELTKQISTKNSWGKNEILLLMDQIEKEEIRRIEKDDYPHPD